MVRSTLEELGKDILIAKFAGFTYEKNLGWYDNEMLMPQVIYDTQRGNCFDDLLFHKSWDWLMLVVEKIETLSFKDEDPVTFAVEIRKNGCRIYRSWTTSDLIDFGWHQDGNKLMSTYNAIIEFIKWYNNENT